MKENPLSGYRQQMIVARVNYFVELASKLYATQFPTPKILFDLAGHSVGMYLVKKKQSFLRFNPWIFDLYFDDHFYETVPHEVAHYIVDQLFKPGRALKPHGLEWKKVMSDFGIKPQVTFKHDLNGIPVRRQRVRLYQCDCQQHELSMTRHNRVSKGLVYICRECGSILIETPQHPSVSQ